MNLVGNDFKCTEHTTELNAKSDAWKNAICIAKFYNDTILL